MPLRTKLPNLLLLIMGSSLCYPCIQAQVETLDSQALNPIPGVGHDYIGALSEVVDPEKGSLSIRIGTTTPPGRHPTLVITLLE